MDPWIHTASGRRPASKTSPRTRDPDPPWIHGSTFCSSPSPPVPVCSFRLEANFGLVAATRMIAALLFSRFSNPPSPTIFESLVPCLGARRGSWACRLRVKACPTRRSNSWTKPSACRSRSGASWRFACSTAFATPILAAERRAGPGCGRTKGAYGSAATRSKILRHSTMADVVLDANVIVGFLDASDAARSRDHTSEDDRRPRG